MTPRIRAILRAPHMAGVAQLPSIANVTSKDLEALEPFIAFCAQYRVTAPCATDIRAFLTLAIPPKPADQATVEVWQKNWLDQVYALEQALHQLGLGATLVDATASVREEFRHRSAYRGHNHGIRRTYRRTVSLAVNDLPVAWQETLRRLRRDQIYSSSILGRMERRLGMFAWSADQAGLTTDMENSDAECALYDDLIDRSKSKAIKNGEDPVAAQPRWAYLRSTAEELKRFGTYHGVSDTCLNRLDRNYRGFSGLEQRQTPLKMFAALQAPTLPVTLAKARIQLTEASALPNAAHRHQRRLKACARGITVACPPRARDVVDRMFWGDGVFYRPDTNSYAFNYVQSKPGHPLAVAFQPSFNMFFNALLLGDNDPRYLPQIRNQAIAQRRPIFFRYEGEPVAYGWFGRVWDEAIGSSSHLARTLLQTFLADMGEVGLTYGKNAIGHRGYRSFAKYRDDHARQISAAIAGDAFSARAETFASDDISDLL
jgi:hypothetical protein